MQKRMVDIIKSLPRLKEKHIRPNFRPENPDSKSSYVKNNVTNLYERNQPIFLWDGSAAHVGVKPSIGADHIFMKGYFRGSDGKTGHWHVLGQGRKKGTAFVSTMEQHMPKHQYGIDNRTSKIYEPISLWDIQRLIDLGRLDPTQIIDITAIINARLLTPADLLWCRDIQGLRLVADGLNEFTAKLNIEFQMGDQEAIAAVEKNGGRFTAAYYDRKRPSIEAAVNPVDYFLRGEPVKKRLLPPSHLMQFYISPKTRGYLADRDLIDRHRIQTAIENGFEPVDISQCPIMSKLKDPRQIWYGVEPGTLVNLEDKAVYRSTIYSESEKHKTDIQIHLEN